MTELTRHIQDRIADALEHLSAATQSDDDYLVGMILSEIESLHRTARENGLVIPEVEQALAAAG